MEEILRQRKYGLLVGLLLSVAAHVFVVWSLRFFPPPPKAPPQISRVEFDIKEPIVYVKDRQKVRDTFVPDELKVRESEDPLAFFSAQNQRVKKQLRALNSGLTANRSQEANQPPQEPQKKKSSPLRKDFFRVAKSDVSMRSSREEERQPSAPTNPLLQLPPGMSTVGEFLPEELEVGSFTALNTDRFLYYSFFARVEELIRTSWEISVHNTIERTPKAFFQTSLQRRWITQLEILLKPNGEFHKALLMKGAGVDGFDWAAMDAFASAKIFPHPPKDMVEADGFIHLKYSFNVHVNPKVLVKQ